MIVAPALASLAASAASAISPPGDIRPVRSIAPTAGIGPAEGGAAQRQLDAVPPAPARPLPRGSLLDLKV
jgi:hypothetical protein